MKTTKQGLDYYPIDVNFLSDYSVQVLIEECGLHSVAVLLELFSRIYRNEGYYLRVDDKLIFVVAKFLSLQREEVRTIIEKAVEGKIFDKELFDNYQILTSIPIQEQFLFATKRRKGVKVNTGYLLVEEKCIQDDDSSPIDVDKKEHSNSNSYSNSYKKEKKIKGRGEGGGELQPPPPPPSPPSWRTDFEVYLKELFDAYRTLIANEQYLIRKKKYYPDVDILLSLEKIVTEFWGTKEGWAHKKNQPEDTIDWKLTFDRQLHYSRNVVLKINN